MTTPGGGGGENEIVFTTSLVPSGDEAEVARGVGERAVAGYREGVATAGAVNLPPLDTAALFDQIDNAVTRMEARVESAARNMGLSLERGFSGDGGFGGQDLLLSWEHFTTQLESYGGRLRENSPIHDLALAVQHDARLIEQGYDAVSTVTRSGRPLNWALNEEGRRFIGDAGTGDVPHIPQGQALRQAAEPGDLDRVRQAGMTAISRVVLDEATYAFEDGQFFRTSSAGSVLRARGAIEDPETQARLQQAVMHQLAASEDDIVRAHLAEISGRDSRFARSGIDPSQNYVSRAPGVGSLGGTDLAEMVHPNLGSVEGLNEALETLHLLGVQAPQVFDSLQTELVRLIEVEEQAARAAALDAEAIERRAAAQAARSARQADLNETFTPRNMSQAYGIGETPAYGDYLRRQFEGLSLPTQTGGAGGQPPTRPPVGALGVPFDDDEQRRYNEMGQRIDAAMAEQTRVAEEARRLAEAEAAGAEGLRRFLANFDGISGPVQTFSITTEMLSRSERELSTQMDAAQQRLSRLATVSQRPGETVSDAEFTRLGRTSVLGGQTTVRDATGGFSEVTDSATLASITEAEALARAQAEVAEQTRVTTAALQQEERALIDLSDAELRARVAAREFQAAQESGDESRISRAIIGVRRAAEALQTEQAPRQGLTGFADSFIKGLTQARGSDGGENNAFLRLRAENGEFLGAIARYQAAYAVIFGVSQALHAAITAEVQAQDVMVEFADATQTAGQGAASLADEMGQIGGRAGFSVAQSMQAATRAVYAFQNQVKSGQFSNEDVARQGVQQAGAVRLLAPTLDPNQSQQQLIAATNGFNLGVEGQARVLDAATNAMRNYGGAIEDTLQALPTLGEVAQQAGLDVEQMANLVSLATSRTAMNGTGVASLLNRVIGNINEKPQTRSLLESFGIDASGSAGQVIQNLATNWDRLAQSQKNQVEAALGGHEVARVLLPILSEGSRLADANRESYDHLGAATELVNQKQHNLAGTLRDIQGQLQMLGRLGVESGLGDLFGGAIQLVSPLVEGVNDILRLFEMMPGSSERWLVRLAEVYGLLLLIGRAQANNLATQEATDAATGVQAAEGGVVAAEQAGGGLFSRLGRRTGVTAVEGAETAGGRLGIGTAASGLGALFTGASGAALGLVALTIAIGATTAAVRRHEEATKGADVAERGFRDARSVDQLRGSADTLATAYQNQREANSGVFGYITKSPEDELRENQLKAQSQWATRMADQIDHQAAALSGSASPLGAFFSNTGDFMRDMTRGIENMTQAGVPAVQMLDNLTSALQHSTTQRGSTNILNTRQNVADFVTSAISGASGVRYSGTDVTAPEPPWWRRALGDVPQPFQQATLAQQRVAGVDPAKVQESIDRVLHDRGVGQFDPIDQSTMSAVANAVADDLAKTAGNLSADAKKRLHDAVVTSLQDAYRQGTSGLVQSLRGPDDFHAFVAGTKDSPGALQNILQSTSGVDPREMDSDLGLLNSQKNFLQDLVSRGQSVGATGNDLLAVEDQLHQVQHKLVQSQLARAQRLRDAALVGVTDPAQIAQINDQSTIEQAKIAIDNQDWSGLVAVMNDASKGALDAVRAMLQHAVDIAQAAYDAASAITIPTDVDPSDIHIYNQAADQKSATQFDALNRAKQNIAGFDASRAQRVPTGRDPRQADETDPLALQRAQIMAGATSGDPVSQAKAAQDAALVALNGSKNQTEYAQNLKAYHDAQRSYVEAISAVKQAQDRAAAAPGDAVGQAAAAVTADREALRTAIRGTAAYAQAQAQLAQDQYAYTQAQNAVASARERALNAHPGNTLAQAQASLDAATRDLNSAFYHSTEWWNAYGQLQQSQYEYSQAVMAQHHQQRLLGVDITDPVATAREDLNAALEKLNYVRSTGNGNIAEEQNAVRSAQARAEAAEFDQRLHDVEFAHNMGTMSDAAYLSYLQSERARLQAIGQRTRQQTEELQQIDQTIKAAADQMQGQWNLGDIRIPTPYEARRYIASQNAGMSYNTNPTITTTQNVTLNINGGNQAEVLALLDQYFGQQMTQRVTTTTRKV